MSIEQEARLRVANITTDDLIKLSVISNKLMAEFDDKFDEWLKTHPTFSNKGDEFIQTIKHMFKGWYLEGLEKGVLAVIDTLK